MPVQLINPPGLAPPVENGYTHISVATGSKTITLAGQVAMDLEGNLVGEGDLAAQTEQALLNAITAFEGGGATMADITKLNYYVVDYTPDKLPILFEGLGRAAQKLGSAPVVPATVVSVSCLFASEFLIEIDGTAVIE